MIDRRVSSLVVVSALLGPGAWGQSVPATQAIHGATIHTLAGSAIDSGTVIIRNGRIVAVGRGIPIPPGAEIIDATGLHAYPGLFDAVSRLGLTEIRSVAQTVDESELGDFNPQLVAATAVHPASEHIPVTRANGITHAVTAPTGGSGSLAGQASLVHLYGWTVEEMLVEPSVGMVLIWPSRPIRESNITAPGASDTTLARARKRHAEAIATLERRLEAARHYDQAQTGAAQARVDRDLKLEALSPVVRGTLPVLIVANAKRDIEDALAFAEREGLRMILAEGRDAWKVREGLAEKNVPVILGATQALPSAEDEAYDEPLSGPGKLHAAGVKIAFGSFGGGTSGPRTLPYEAGNAVPYGLPHEEALRSVTIHPAEIFGVADRLGTLEVGKIANLVVTDGDPLDIRTRIVHVFVNGEPTGVENKHQTLYERYRGRP